MLNKVSLQAYVHCDVSKVVKIYHLCIVTQLYVMVPLNDFDRMNGNVNLIVDVVPVKTVPQFVVDNLVVKNNTGFDYIMDSIPVP